MRREGRGPAGPLLSLRGVRTGRPVSRVGLVVPKRVGTAVVRNRLKRRLRAALAALPLATGWDFVISVRPAAANASYAELAAALADLLARVRALQTAPRAEEPMPERQQTR